MQLSSTPQSAKSVFAPNLKPKPYESTRFPRVWAFSIVLAVSAAFFPTRDRITSSGATTVTIQNLCVVGWKSLDWAHYRQFVERVRNLVLVVINPKAKVCLLG
jgi:hypothetical protein